MKRLLYLILRKNIIKRLMEKHGDQFTNDVLKTFELKEIPELKRSIRGNVLVDQSAHREDRVACNVNA